MDREGERDPLRGAMIMYIRRRDDDGVAAIAYKQVTACIPHVYRRARAQSVYEYVMAATVSSSGVLQFVE